jgi:hypothetical protein
MALEQENAVEAGLAQKADEFRKQGAELYL